MCKLLGNYKHFKYSRVTSQNSILFQDTAAKRASYVRCVASLLSKCSMDTKHKVKSYGPVIFFVLKDIESVAGSGQ